MGLIVSPPGNRGRDPFTKLLLNGDTLLDSSLSGKGGYNSWVTVATPPTTHPYLAKAAYFSTAYLHIPDSADWAFGTQDFRIGLWAYTLHNPSYWDILIAQSADSGSGDPQWNLSLVVTRQIYFLDSALSATVGSGTLSAIANAWHRIEVARVGSTCRIYVDGTRLAETTVTGAVPDRAYPLRIGYGRDPAGNGAYFNGYMADLEILVGAGACDGYTGATCPVPSAPVQRTALHKLLLPMDGSRPLTEDLSRTNKEIVNAGTTVVNTPWWHPYLKAMAQFDGSSGLSVPASPDFAFGTGDFTVEFTFYIKNTSADRLFDFGVGNIAFDAEPANGCYFLWVGSTSWAKQWSFTFQQNTFYFVQLIKQSGAFSLYVNGTQVGTSYASSLSLTSTGVLGIGKFTYVASDYLLYGGLAEVRVSNVARTPGMPTGPLAADANTKLFIPMRTVGGGFTDTTGKTVTTSGAPTIAALPSAQAPGAKSLYFNGSSSLYSLAGDDFDLFDTATRDFTVDYYINAINYSANPRPLSFGNYNSRGWWVYMQGGNLGIYMFDSTGTQRGFGATYTTPSSSWFHVAFVRKDGMMYLFVAGLLVASSAFAYQGYAENSQSGLSAGVNRVGSPQYYFSGYMANLRISKGIARWTKSFTPPVMAL